MSYPSSLKDAQWVKISHFFKIENQAKHDKRDLTNAVLYLVKTGCQWRQMPKDFPPWPTVQSFFRRAKQKGIWGKILRTLVKEERKQCGRKPKPTYGVVDSQSVKTTSSSIDREIDCGKKIKGRKRHIVTDTQGSLLHVTVHAANIHDTKRAAVFLNQH